jgi:hypothetical protein
MRQMIDAAYHERGEHLSICGNPSYRDAPEPDAMVGALAADDASARSLAPDSVICNGDLERCIDSLGAGIGEEDAIRRSSGQGRDAPCQLECRRMGYLKARAIVEALDLIADSLDNARIRVPERCTPKSRETVENAPSIKEGVIRSAC